MDPFFTRFRHDQHEFRRFREFFPRIPSNLHPGGFCGSRTTSQAQGEEHFDCEICGAGFETLADQQCHLDKEHYQCAKCQMHFDSAENLTHHFKHSRYHNANFCRICNICCKDPNAWWQHMINLHIFCDSCGRTFPKMQLLDEHITSHHPESQPKPATMQNEDDKLNWNHYETLRIHPSSSHCEVLRSARLQRIACHPDRLLNQKGLSAKDMDDIQIWAKKVGQAADILSDPELRAKYDLEMYSRV